MGQEAPSAVLNHNLKKITPNNIASNQQTVQFEGILKIESVPFKGCQRIEINGRAYFMQRSTRNLSDLIAHKARINKKFTSNQVTNMIINLVYTLAYLESIQIAYPDLSLNNIYLSNGKFKLMPPQFVNGDTYTQLKQNLKYRRAQYTAASPQLIIAARCHQPVVKQQQILLKSNVFSLGMAMLQVCTLKNSAECYDLITYEILDTVITERIQEIQACYQDARIARIVANMLDYDYQQRMKPADLAVWINRQINQSSPLKQQRTPFFNKAINDLKSSENVYKETVKSRLMEQIIVDPQKEENFHYEQREQFQDNTKRKHSRLKDIRSKIIKQKMKNNMARAESPIQGRTAEGSCNKKKTEKNLPNPYLMRPYEKTPSKLNTRKYLPQKQVLRGQHSGTRRQEIERSTNLNLRYKYNVTNQDNLNQDELRLSSGRKFSYIRQGSGNRSIEKLSYDEIIKRSTSRVKQQPNLNISRFTYEAIQTPNFTSEQPKKSKTPLKQRFRINTEQPEGRYYERHQQIEWGKSNAYIKNYPLQKQGITREVKRTQKLKEAIQQTHEKEMNENTLRRQYNVSFSKHARF